jgi:hypothetical protein
MASRDRDEALALCKSILELLPDLPERAEEFAAGIEERVSSMQAWIESAGTATPAQIRALENMKAGVEKWLP